MKQTHTDIYLRGRIKQSIHSSTTIFFFLKKKKLEDGHRVKGVLGICHIWEACLIDIEGEASGACLQACLQHELQRHIWHTKLPHLRNKSRLQGLSHTHHTESSCSSSSFLQMGFKERPYQYQYEPLPDTTRQRFLQCELVVGCSKPKICVKGLDEVEDEKQKTAFIVTVVGNKCREKVFGPWKRK